MTAAILVPLGALLGLPLRRMFGGWLGLSRSLCVAILVVATVAPAWWTWGNFQSWELPVVGCAPMAIKALVVTLLAAGFWTDGHRFDRPLMLLGRYGWAPVVLAIVTGFWPAVLVGPVVAGAAVVFRWWAAPVVLPWDSPQRRQMLDGWAAWWECSLGAIGVGVFWAAALV